MERTTYTCDVCGRTKQETNRWFKLATAESVFVVVHWDGIMPEVDPIPVQHLCGAECIMKKLSEYLGIQRQISPE